MQHVCRDTTDHYRFMYPVIPCVQDGELGGRKP